MAGEIDPHPPSPKPSTKAYDSARPSRPSRAALRETSSRAETLSASTGSGESSLMSRATAAASFSFGGAKRPAHAGTSAVERVRELADARQRHRRPRIVGLAEPVDPDRRNAELVSPGRCRGRGSARRGRGRVESAPRASRRRPPSAGVPACTSRSRSRRSRARTARRVASIDASMRSRSVFDRIPSFQPRSCASVSPACTSSKTGHPEAIARGRSSRPRAASARSRRRASRARA